jgi:hypothetical protein
VYRLKGLQYTYVPSQQRTSRTYFWQWPSGLTRADFAHPQDVAVLAPIEGSTQVCRLNDLLYIYKVPRRLAVHMCTASAADELHVLLAVAVRADQGRLCAPAGNPEDVAVLAALCRVVRVTEVHAHLAAGRPSRTAHESRQQLLYLHISPTRSAVLLLYVGTIGIS